jgi:glyoxylase-like metal-dependent hydrolase (beta-lactamase superfamily II)
MWGRLPPLVVDVREPDEVAVWSIAGSVNIPLGQLEARRAELGDRPVVVVCASGGRSAQAAVLLAEAGLVVSDLRGGMKAWAQLLDEATATVGDFELVQLRRLGRGCLSYLVGRGNQAIVVDPGFDVEPYEIAAASRGWQVVAVCDTHVHADHVSGARRLAERTGARLRLAPADGYEFDFEPLADDEPLAVGDAAVTALSVPGHTEGSTAYALGSAGVLTGDVLFVDGVGRPDLADRAEAFARQLHASLHERLLRMPAHALVLPAHVSASIRMRPGLLLAGTIGELSRRLDVLGLDDDAFVEWAVGRTTPRPPGHETIVAVNQGRLTLTDAEVADLELGPNRCAA